jgi:glycosyltransferase involved in cell wall biosynthesis
VIAAAIDNHAEPFWQIADRTAVEKGFEPDHTLPAYLDLLVAANQFIRNERRRKLLVNLAPHAMHLVWSGPKPDITLHPGTVVTAGNTLAETLALCRQAKAMVMCLNSFSYSLSERLLSAMERGAAALCIRNAMIDDTFKDGEDILALNGHGENVGAQLARLRERGFGDRITAAARAKVVREFSPDVCIAQFVSALEQFHGARA